MNGCPRLTITVSSSVGWIQYYKIVDSRMIDSLFSISGSIIPLLRSFHRFGIALIRATSTIVRDREIRFVTVADL